MYECTVAVAHLWCSFLWYGPAVILAWCNFEIRPFGQPHKKLAGSRSFQAVLLVLNHAPEKACKNLRNSGPIDGFSRSRGRGTASVLTLPSDSYMFVQECLKCFTVFQHFKKFSAVREKTLT